VKASDVSCARCGAIVGARCTRPNDPTGVLDAREELTYYHCERVDAALALIYNRLRIFSGRIAQLEDRP
jgi:hypothetical protein